MELHQEPEFHINNHSELCELKVIDNFIHNFELSYGIHHVAFAQKPFHQVLLENIFSPSETWRVIALYLHHDNDPFAQNWCKQLASEETITILEQCFCVLPWDITDHSSHESLQETLSKYLKHSFNNFKHQKSGVIFILQLNGIPSVVSILQGNDSSEDILHTLKEIREILKTESASFQQECNKHEESPSNVGSYRFQQNMFELLGDRDYDCFDYNQMDELKKKIGFALFGAPPEIGYSKKELNQIGSIFNNIIKENKNARYKDQVIIAFIFNCTEPLPQEKHQKMNNPGYSPDADIGAVPIFVLKKCYSKCDHGCRIFIDHEGRIYTSWTQYIDNNRLGKCMMVLPKNGRYRVAKNGTVLLKKHYSPACKMGAKVARITDISASGIGLVSGGILAAAAVPAVTLAPLAVTGAVVAGATAGAISIIRSTISLIDMKKHKQDMNVIRSKEARGAALNIAAGSVGVLGTGATAVLSKVVSRGVNVGKVGQGVVNTLNTTNLAIGAAALGNSMHHVYFSWKDGDTISSLTILQLVTSSLFFANSVYSFKSATTIIEENQPGVLDQMKSILLGSNRRKISLEMHKDTIRINGGNKQAGSAEVISTIRNIPNKNEVFEILKANNKLFNKNGVRFSVLGSKILFNDKALSLGSFDILSKPQRLEILSEMPTTLVPQQASPCSLSIDIFNRFNQADILKLTSFGIRLYTHSTSFNHALQITLQEFSECNKKKKYLQL
ncbi:uncharacterized protein LOC108736956 [Agrilus planipennis]|uniref:Uncharacterized protein LOC108736956 n=1 Tax=Agrilus planipennis TaxID=224129 RepID=A0A1W4WYD5_AGRPL|nr:uncharacterized protein LOC108736956 [Agrilus planipennis]